MELTLAKPLVSVIIPCYNAERWVAESIQSALDQTYEPIEVIVVDDGSTDGSLEIVKSFGDKVRWETGPNRGGNQARNRGFELSKGRYVQFLDADDYILAEKIEKQINFLKETSAQVVYGDWRHRYHLPNGHTFLGDVVISQAQEDVLESLLSNWWVAPVSLLVKRDAVIKCGGWDERLRIAQDRDFFLSLAISGTEIGYQSGCQSVYRRYGKSSLSTSNKSLWLQGHVAVLEKAKKTLEISNRLSSKYRYALARSYFTLARNYYDSDRDKYLELMNRTLEMHPGFIPDQSYAYALIQRLCGFGVADKVASFKRNLAKHLR